MHIADLDLGILGANGIVGGGIGIATGAAYSADLRGSGQVAVCFFGDGASNQGILMEAANMAALWKLPVIYLCEENKYAEFSPSLPFIAVERIELKAQAFGLPGVTVDGNDVLAVYEAVQPGRRSGRARGDGPTLLVAQTYRIEGHTVGDPLTYRPKGEAEAWKAPERDPISRFGRYLVERGRLCTDEELESLQHEGRGRDRGRRQFAASSPEPEIAALWEDVYAWRAESVGTEEASMTMRATAVRAGAQRGAARRDGPRSHRSAYLAKTLAAMAARSRSPRACTSASARSGCATRPSPRPASAGIAVGAAMTGLRPVVEILYVDFQHPGHGPDRQPGGQGALHVRRQGPGAAGHPRPGWRRARQRRPALPEPGDVVRAHPRPDRHPACHALRRQGTAQVGHPQ